MCLELLNDHCMKKMCLSCLKKVKIRSSIPDLVHLRVFEDKVSERLEKNTPKIAPTLTTDKQYFI